MIDVIIPIYKGLQQTRRCIDSVLQHRQAAPFEVVAVDDASPDPDIAALSRRARRGATASRSCATRRIAASCSRSTAAWPASRPRRGAAQQRYRGGERLARSALPRARTPTRMSARSRRSPTTPRSARTRSKAGREAFPERSALAALDRLFATTNAGRTVDLPTAVGFCMCDTARVPRADRALRRGALRPRLRRGKRLLHARRRRRAGATSSPATCSSITKAR